MKMRLLMLSLLSTLLACGPSPILQHATAGEPTQRVAEKAETRLHSRWLQGPAVGSESVLVASFTDQNGQVLTLSNLQVELWMPDMGHGSAPVKIEAQADGSYLIKQMYFIMGGTWEVHFRDGDRVLVTLVVNL
ncbi:MAG: FixH family protein [Bdellovibrionaceae bacterium]|nr:FixH family protein [Pseudobdellovibrionaceae bacterium]